MTSDRAVRNLNLAGEAVQAAKHELSNCVWDLQTAVERLLPIATDLSKFEPLLAHCELRTREVRASLERLNVRLEQLQRLAAVAARR